MINDYYNGCQLCVLSHVYIIVTFRFLGALHVGDVLHILLLVDEPPPVVADVTGQGHSMAAASRRIHRCLWICRAVEANENTETKQHTRTVNATM